jgi:hypothetical protein
MGKGNIKIHNKTNIAWYFLKLNHCTKTLI